MAILATFNNNTNGANPYDALIKDSNGKSLRHRGEWRQLRLRGAAFSRVPYNTGTSTYGTLLTLAAFTGGQRSGLPTDRWPWTAAATCSGLRIQAGRSSSWRTGAARLSTLASFFGSNGANPDSNLVEDSSGNLFGTTLNGGTNNKGTVFSVSPLKIATISLPNWTVNAVNYNQTLSTTGANGTVTFATTSGTVPRASR